MTLAQEVRPRGGRTEVVAQSQFAGKPAQDRNLRVLLSGIMPSPHGTARFRHDERLAQELGILGRKVIGFRVTRGKEFDAVVFEMEGDAKLLAVVDKGLVMAVEEKSRAGPFTNSFSTFTFGRKLEPPVGPTDGVQVELDAKHGVKLRAPEALVAIRPDWLTEDRLEVSVGTNDFFTVRMGRRAMVGLVGINGEEMRCIGIDKALDPRKAANLVYGSPHM